MQIVINITKKLYHAYKKKDHMKRCDIDAWEKAIDRCIILPNDKKAVDAVIKALLEQEPETVTEFADRCKTAYWIRWYEEVDHGKYVEHIPYCKCSECGKKYGPHLSLSINYCSNCGRKMVEKESEEKHGE